MDAQLTYEIKNKKINIKRVYNSCISTHIPNYCRTVAIAPTSSDPAPGRLAPTNTPNASIIMLLRDFQ